MCVMSAMNSKDPFPITSKPQLISLVATYLTVDMLQHKYTFVEKMNGVIDNTLSVGVGDLIRNHGEDLIGGGLMAYIGGEAALKLLSEQKPPEKVSQFIENNRDVVRSVIGLAGFAAYEGFQAAARGIAFDWKDMAAYTVSTLLWSHKKDILNVVTSAGRLLGPAANALFSGSKDLKP